MGFKEIIQKYLEDFASKDEAFAAKFANEKKSIDGCIKYIENKVIEKRKNNEKCLAFEGSEIYGIALHYYDEEDVEVKQTDVKVEVACSPSPETTAKKRSSRKKKADEAKVVDLNGLAVTIDSDDTDIEFPMF